MRRPRSLAVAVVVIARQQRQRILAGFGATAMTGQLIDFGTEGFYVLKASVDRRESHIAHLVQMPQLLHDHLTHAARSNFPFSQAAQLVANSGHRSFDGVAADGALFQPLLHSVAYLLLVQVSPP